MKKRKGFRKIILDDKEFQFNWANAKEGPMLILYDESDNRYVIPRCIWDQQEESQEYLSKENPTWRGKYKKEACFAGWGKREAREMWRKYKLQNA